MDRKLEWAAVNHHDTDHPHAHLVIRGVDRDGLEVRLARAYIFERPTGARPRARHCGARTSPRLDVQRTRVREVTEDRFTSLDREIERRAKDNHVEVTSQPGPIDPCMLVARLKHLEGC